jgi:hypothetical protein
MAQLSRPTDPSQLSTCPSCDSDVLNVQGIHACSTCSWVTPEYR